MNQLVHSVLKIVIISVISFIVLALGGVSLNTFLIIGFVLLVSKFFSLNRLY